MSKQSKAKEEQQYVAKAVPRTCSTCRHFKQDKVLEPTCTGEVWARYTNLRCGIGGFAVKKMGTCRLWETVMEAL